MTTRVGLRELRQDASDIVRRAEQGEQIEITVAGRPAARLVTIAPRQWVTWAAIADAFVGRADADWENDRELVDQSVVDPWGSDS